jgi:hypothetical protein
MSIIVDDELKQDISDTLVDEYGFTREEADEWIEEHYEFLVEKMYEAQRDYIDNYALKE